MYKYCLFQQLYVCYQENLYCGLVLKLSAVYDLVYGADQLYNILGHLNASDLDINNGLLM